MGHNNTGESNSYALTFTDKNPNFQPFMMKGWSHYDAIFDLMLKKIKGTHVFQPSNRSQGAAFNDHHSLIELPPQSFLLLSLLTCHPLPS